MPIDRRDDDFDRIIQLMHSDAPWECLEEEILPFAERLLPAFVPKMFRWVRATPEWNDVLVLAQVFLLNKLRELGLPAEYKRTHLRGRLGMFLRFSNLEAIQEVVPKKRRRELATVSMHDHDESMTDEGSPNAVLAAQEGEQQAALVKCISELNELPQIVFLNRQEGIEPEEIGKKLGKSRENIDGILRRARKNLLECMRAKGFIDD